MTRKPRARIKNAIQIALSERHACFELYLKREMGLEAIALQLKVSPHSLKHLAEQEDWATKRLEIESLLQSKFERDLMTKLVSERSKIIDRHTLITENLDRHIFQHLKGKRKLSPSKLETLSKALNSSAAIAARAVGLDKMTHAGFKIIQPGVKSRKLEPHEVEVEQKKGTGVPLLSP